MSLYVKVRSKVITEDDPKYESYPKFPLTIHSVGYPWGDHNGYYSWLKEEVDKWCRKYIKNDDLYNKSVIDDWGGYGNAASFRVFVSKERLLHSSKLMYWGLIFDDFMEEIVEKSTGKSYVEQMRKFNNHLEHNRYDPNDPICPNEDIFHMYGDVLQSMKDTGLTKFQLRRAIKGCDDYLNENVDYFEKRFDTNEPHYKDVEEFKEHRRLDAWMEWMYLGAEYNCGIEIDEETYYNPMVRKCYILTTDFVWGINDIGSYCKELIADNACKNFIAVYAAQNNVSIYEAHDVLVKFCKDTDVNLQKSLKEVINSELILQCPGLVILCKYALPDIAYGIGMWQEMSGRYRANGITRWEITNPSIPFEEKLKIMGKTYFD